MCTSLKALNHAQYLASLMHRFANSVINHFTRVLFAHAHAHAHARGISCLWLLMRQYTNYYEAEWLFVLVRKPYVCYFQQFVEYTAYFHCILFTLACKLHTLNPFVIHFTVANYTGA